MLDAAGSQKDVWDLLSSDSVKNLPADSEWGKRFEEWKKFQNEIVNLQTHGLSEFFRDAKVGETQKAKFESWVGSALWQKMKKDADVEAATTTTTTTSTAPAYVGKWGKDGAGDIQLEFDENHLTDITIKGVVVVDASAKPVQLQDVSFKSDTITFSVVYPELNNGWGTWHPAQFSLDIPTKTLTESNTGGPYKWHRVPTSAKALEYVGGKWTRDGSTGWTKDGKGSTMEFDGNQLKDITIGGDLQNEDMPAPLKNLSITPKAITFEVTYPALKIGWKWGTSQFSLECKDGSALSEQCIPTSVLKESKDGSTVASWVSIGSTIATWEHGEGGHVAPPTPTTTTTTAAIQDDDKIAKIGKSEKKFHNVKEKLINAIDALLEGLSTLKNTDYANAVENNADEQEFPFSAQDKWEIDEKTTIDKITTPEDSAFSISEILVLLLKYSVDATTTAPPATTTAKTAPITGFQKVRNVLQTVFQTTTCGGAAEADKKNCNALKAVVDCTDDLFNPGFGEVNEPVSEGRGSVCLGTYFFHVCKHMPFTNIDNNSRTTTDISDVVGSGQGQEP